MTRRVDPAAAMAVDAAFSYIKPKTVAQVVSETGLPDNVVKRIVRELEADDSVERRGNRYRYHNTAPWPR